jgi:ABC-2 type transport system permease protein
MKKYLLAIRITAQEVLEYRFNFTIHVLKYSLAVSMMALVWLAIQTETNIEGLTPESTVRYFFFAAILYGLSNFHTWYIEEDIKEGRLSKYITKPYSYYLFSFTKQLTRTSIDLIIKLIVMIPLLKVFGFGFNPSLVEVLIFIFYIPLIYIFTFITQFTIASIAFWLKEVYSLRWVSLSVSRFLAGIIVPLNLLPNKFVETTFYLPFQHLAYTPIQAIQGNISPQHAGKGMLVLIFWIFVAWIIKEKIWQRGVCSYEAIGI